MSNFKLGSGYKKGKKPLIIMVISLLFLAIISVLLCYFWYKSQLKPVNPSEQSVTSFVVETGDSPNLVADRLEQEGLIKDAKAFKLFIKLNRYGSLMPGEYSVSSGYDARKVADSVFNSKPSTVKITLIPGKTVADYKKTFIDAGYRPEDVEAAFNYEYPNLSLKDKPENQSLEGYLHPQTYTNLNRLEDTPIKIISTNLDETDQLITESFRKSIAEKGLNIHQAFTLASIIQQESPDPEIQKKIAQVFLLRLKQDISLGSDVTFIYAAKISGQKSSPDIDSPYNTRIHKGLPPGPIGTFNQSALDALVNPAEGDYLFFVAGDDGNTYFSKTDAEHEALASKYCIELCKIY